MKRIGELRSPRKALEALLALGLILSIVGPQASAKDRKAGIQVRVVLKDGLEVEGELLAVRDKNLILADTESMSSDEISVDEIARIRIFRKSKAGSGLIIGFLGGGGFGAAVGGLSGGPHHFMDFDGGTKASC
jgi:small nuclear ribonucleoprotein (snRNP)-like protein